MYAVCLKNKKQIKNIKNKQKTKKVKNIEI